LPVGSPDVFSENMNFLAFEADFPESLSGGGTGGGLDCE
jgi:hypothetical protein